VGRRSRVRRLSAIGYRLSVPIALASCGRIGFDRLDGGSDGASNGDGGLCYGTGLVQVCFASVPTGSVTLGASLDTASAACATIAGGRGLDNAPCVFAADTITVPGSTSATGSKPLILVATTSIMIDGTLDAASHNRVTLGAGGNFSSCDGGNPAVGDGGGAGGSFGSFGGQGGTGSIGTGATTGFLDTAAALRGGCQGSPGAGPGAGDGGFGGGAVYLIAGTSISVAGDINASGGGGDNGSVTGPSGGCGGGAGGMIGLDAPRVDVFGDIYANGGAGGGGATPTASGGNGSDPGSATVAAPGGVPGGTAGAGGDGSLGATGGSSGEAAGTSGSGGGGGGGGGVIKLYHSTGTLAGNISPPPS